MAIARTIRTSQCPCNSIAKFPSLIKNNALWDHPIGNVLLMSRLFKNALTKSHFPVMTDSEKIVSILRNSTYGVFVNSGNTNQLRKLPKCQPFRRMPSEHEHH